MNGLIGEDHILRKCGLQAFLNLSRRLKSLRNLNVLKPENPLTTSL